MPQVPPQIFFVGHLIGSLLVVHRVGFFGLPGQPLTLPPLGVLARAIAPNGLGVFLIFL